MATVVTTVRFYGGVGNPLGCPHGAVIEHSATVEHDDDSAHWERNRLLLRAIARKLTAKRAAEVAASFGTEQRAKAIERAVARTSGHVTIPTNSHGTVFFQIIALTTTEGY